MKRRPIARRRGGEAFVWRPRSAGDPRSGLRADPSGDLGVTQIHDGDVTPPVAVDGTSR